MGTFPTVRSDPWKKGQKKRRGRRGLWSPEQWKRLVKAAKEEYGFRWREPNLADYGIGPLALAVIRQFNEG
jgi:hypothetical protein